MYKKLSVRFIPRNRLTWADKSIDRRREIILQDLRRLPLRKSGQGKEPGDQTSIQGRQVKGVKEMVIVRG